MIDENDFEVGVKGEGGVLVKVIVITTLQNLLDCIGDTMVVEYVMRDDCPGDRLDVSPKEVTCPCRVVVKIVDSLL